jgi:uncharacterized protein
MKNTITFTTAKGNIFLYSPFRKQFLLIHPLIRHLYQMEKSGVHLPGYIDQVRSDGKTEIKGFDTFSYDEVRQQYSKYRFLQKQHFLAPVNRPNLGGILSPARIEENIGKLQQVILETTEECNLACTYCTYSKFYINTERGRQKMNFEKARQILELVLSKRNLPANPELIISFYGGEPLKNFALISEVIHFLNTYSGPKPVLKFSMSSNGLLLAKYMDFLAANDVEVAISLDGDKKGNSFRVLKNEESSYDLVIQNLERVQNKYPDYFDRKITFLTVLHSRNSYKSTYAFFMKKFKKIPAISTINTLNLNEQHKQEFYRTFLNSKKNRRSDLKTIKSLMHNHPAIKELTDSLEKYSGYVYKDHGRLTLRGKDHSKRKNFIPTGTCIPFSLRIFITTNGLILPCEHISRIFEIGSVGDNGPVIDAETIASTFNHYYSKIRPLCEQCFLDDGCMECMFNTKIETDHPECEFFTDEKHFSNRLSKQLSLIEKDYSFYLRILNETFDEN